jgi:hypothetical protein
MSVHAAPGASVGLQRWTEKSQNASGSQSVTSEHGVSMSPAMQKPLLHCRPGSHEVNVVHA